MGTAGQISEHRGWLVHPQRWGALVLSVLWLMLMVGCGAYRKSEPAPPSSYLMAAEVGAVHADMAMEEMVAPMAAPAPGVRSRLGAEPRPAVDPSPDGGQPKDAQATAASPARKIHYAGHARLRVQSVEEATDALSTAAQELGGFVESVAGRVVTVRVPAEVFEEAFDRMVGLGELLDRSISARDVTEAFTAVDLRLSTARQTRDRLVELLARAEDEREKLALIQQIQRVSEEIDRLESQLRTLSSLASMSRITMELVTREAQAWREQGQETSEMAWIRSLSPFQPDLISEGRKLMLPVPTGMVQLSPGRPFIAEGPDGSRIWSGRLPNEPVGDGAFWVDAIRTRLASEFASVEVVEVGGFVLLQLTDRGDTPYTWWIGLRPDGRWLDVVEVYFPTPAELERFEGPVLEALGKGGAA